MFYDHISFGQVCNRPFILFDSSFIVLISNSHFLLVKDLSLMFLWKGPLNCLLEGKWERSRTNCNSKPNLGLRGDLYLTPRITGTEVKFNSELRIVERGAVREQEEVVDEANSWGQPNKFNHGGFVLILTAKRVVPRVIGVRNRDARRKGFCSMK